MIENFFYNGVDAGLWDLNHEEDTNVKPVESKKKKKKSSHKKKRTYVNPERQTNEEDLEADESPYIPFLIGREAI